jgi:DNA-binding XRE family transcriptional regulator
MCRIRTPKIITQRRTMSLEQHISAIDGFEPGLQALFGSRLKETRRQTDLTQTALAESAGLRRQYAAKIKRAAINAALATMAAVTRIQSVAVGGMLQIQVPQKIASNQIIPLAAPACT